MTGAADLGALATADLEQIEGALSQIATLAGSRAPGLAAWMRGWVDALRLERRQRAENEDGTPVRLVADLQDDNAVLVALVAAALIQTVDGGDVSAAARAVLTDVAQPLVAHVDGLADPVPIEAQPTLH